MDFVIFFEEQKIQFNNLFLLSLSNSFESENQLQIHDFLSTLNCI